MAQGKLSIRYFIVYVVVLMSLVLLVYPQSAVEILRALPEEQRTLAHCIAAVQEILPQIRHPDMTLAKDVLALIPAWILLSGFIGGNIRDFAPNYDGALSH